MHMGALAIDANSGVAHDRDVLTTLHSVSGVDVDLAQMSVQTVVRRTVPTMVDDDVLAVIRIIGDRIRVNDFAVANRAYFIERFAVRIAVDRFNVDSFVESRVNSSGGRRLRIANKAVLAAFPRIRFRAVIIALDVLIKLGASAVKQRVIVGRQTQLDRVRVVAHYENRARYDDRSNSASHRFFFSPTRRQHFLNASMSAFVSPDAM